MGPKRFLVLDDGELCEITNMFDVDGDETEDPDFVVSIVARAPNGTWFAQAINPEDWRASPSRVN